MELLYGERDWMDCRHGNRAANAVSGDGVSVAVRVVKEAPMERGWFGRFI